MKAIQLAALAGFALALNGCAQTVDFTPTSNAVQAGSLQVATYQLVAEHGGPATITVVGQGVVRPNQPGFRNGAIVVAFTIRSSAMTPVSITDANIVDDQGRSPMLARVDRQDPGEVYGYVSGLHGPPTSMPSEEVSQIEFVFNLPPGTSLDQVKTFKLKWTSEIGDESQQFETEFVRQSAAPLARPAGPNDVNHESDDLPFRDSYEGNYFRAVMGI